MNIIPLVKKPYVNEVTLNRQNLNPARPLNWNCACEGGWDLFKEVLWVSVGQIALKLQAVKVEGLTKNSAPGPRRISRVQPGFNSHTIGSPSNFDSL